MTNRVSLTTDIPPNREIVVHFPSEVPTGPASLEIIVESGSKNGENKLGDLLDSGFVGIWKDRQDIRDSSEFARSVREVSWKRK